MPDPNPLPLAAFWARFHTIRNLRKPAFKRWAVACILGFVALRTLARERGGDTGELVILWIAPLLGLFFGSGVLREEIEDQTLTYGFTRPLGRGWIYAARGVAAMGPALALTLPLVVLGMGDLDGGSALRMLLAAVLSVMAYTGVFALLGVLLKWSTWVGLGWLLFWEGFGSLAPGFIGRLTLQTHLRGIAGRPPVGGLLSSFWTPPPVPVSVLVLLATAAASLFLGGYFVNRREFALEK